MCFALATVNIPAKKFLMETLFTCTPMLQNGGRERKCYSRSVVATLFQPESYFWHDQGKKIYHPNILCIKILKFSQASHELVIAEYVLTFFFLFGERLQFDCYFLSTAGLWCLINVTKFCNELKVLPGCIEFENYCLILMTCTIWNQPGDA